MNKHLRFAACVAGAFLLLLPLNAQTPDSSADTQPPGPLPGEFNDPATGARIIVLSKDPHVASGVIYFTQDCITPDSRYALVRDLVPTAGHTAGIMWRYDFKTGEIVKITDLMTKNQVMAPKSGNMYYYSDGGRDIYVTNILDLKTRKIADIPQGLIGSDGITFNADETLLAGVAGLAQDSQPISTTAPNQGSNFDNTYNRHDTNILFDIDIKTGKYTELQRIKTWLGHNQFSPTDPNILMYCHEGPWALVDRIWTLHIDDPSTPHLLLKRTEVNEIAGHEFWSADGTTIWYDHNFRNNPSKHYLEGTNVSTGEVTRYPITAPFVSIHYTQSPDGKFFVCDGGTNKGNPNAQAMYILVPTNGKLQPIKLCSMSRNNYTDAEPNPHLTPDQHWAIFTATFTGVSQAYAVEMPKQFWR